MNDPFAILGVPRRFRLDLRDLEQRHRDLSRALHPDKYAQASPSERRMAIEKAAEVNEAFRKLRHSQSRAAALLASVGRTVDETSRAEPALLAEMLELREQLEAARSLTTGRDRVVGNLRATVDTQASQAEHEIAAAFDGRESPDPAAVDKAYQALIRLRYLHRFLDEADAMLEE